MQNNLVRGPLEKVGIHEQSIFIIICISMRYKFDLFVVRCPALLLQILRFAQNDNEMKLRMTGRGFPFMQHRGSE